MDTISPPIRKAITRATRAQSAILFAAFAKAHNGQSSVTLVNALSEETGLPAKWITSWFIRQRKKKRDNGTKVGEEMKKIYDFKSEYQDPALADSGGRAATESTPTGSTVSRLTRTRPRTNGTTVETDKRSEVDSRDKLPAKKKVRTGNPTPKVAVKTESDDEGSLSNDMPPSSMTSTLTLPVVPSMNMPSTLGDSTLDTTGLTSNFILREMVPRMWVPPISKNPTTGPSNSAPALKDSKFAAPVIPRRSQLYASPAPPGPKNNMLPANATTAHRGSLFTHGNSSYSVGCLNSEIPVQSHVSNPRMAFQPASHINLPALYQSQAPSHLVMREPKKSTGLIPWFGQVLPAAQPSQVYFDENLGRDRQISYGVPRRTHNERSNLGLGPLSGAGVVPALRTTHPQQLLDMTASTYRQDVDQENVIRPLSLQQSQYAALLDPTTTPLKHLTVLEPFDRHLIAGDLYAALNPDKVLEQLLDDQLSAVDPFQTAMGLAFLSRLGLQWD